MVTFEEWKKQIEDLLDIFAEIRTSKEARGELGVKVDPKKVEKEDLYQKIDSLIDDMPDEIIIKIGKAFWKNMPTLSDYEEPLELQQKLIELRNKLAEENNYDLDLTTGIINRYLKLYAEQENTTIVNDSESDEKARENDIRDMYALYGAELARIMLDGRISEYGWPKDEIAKLREHEKKVIKERKQKKLEEQRRKEEEKKPKRVKERKIYSEKEKILRDAYKKAIEQVLNLFSQTRLERDKETGVCKRPTKPYISPSMVKKAAELPEEFIKNLGKKFWDEIPGYLDRAGRKISNIQKEFLRMRKEIAIQFGIDEQLTSAVIDRYLRLYAEQEGEKIYKRGGEHDVDCRYMYGFNWGDLSRVMLYHRLTGYMWTADLIDRMRARRSEKR